MNQEQVKEFIDQAHKEIKRISFRNAALASACVVISGVALGIPFYGVTVGFGIMIAYEVWMFIMGQALQLDLRRHTEESDEQTLLEYAAESDTVHIDWLSVVIGAMGGSSVILALCYIMTPIFPLWYVTAFMTGFVGKFIYYFMVQWKGKKILQEQQDESDSD